MAHILIVEDNVSIAKIWGVKLQKEGFEVSLAKTGKEGMDLAREKKPSLILMDIMIPGIDGIEVFQQLRQSVETADIPVLFLSSSVKDRSEIQKILDMGAEGFIIKSEISPGDLVTRINDVLAKRS
jgi:DNA-binding response OmpR family regulator